MSDVGTGIFAKGRVVPEDVAVVASHCYVECRITFLLPGYVLVD